MIGDPRRPNARRRSAWRDAARSPPGSPTPSQYAPRRAAVKRLARIGRTLVRPPSGNAKAPADRVGRPAEGLQGKTRRRQRVAALPRPGGQAGAPVRLSSSMPMRVSSLSTQHLIFRQVSTRPRRQCEPTRFETTPSRRMPSASAKTSGPLPAIASLNCRRDLGDGGTIRRSSALRSSSAARSRASVEAAAIGSIDIGAASLPEKRPLTSFIGLGESDVAGARLTFRTRGGSAS